MSIDYSRGHGYGIVVEHDEMEKPRLLEALSELTSTDLTDLEYWEAQEELFELLPEVIDCDTVGNTMNGEEKPVFFLKSTWVDNDIYDGDLFASVQVLEPQKSNRHLDEIHNTFIKHGVKCSAPAWFVYGTVS